jgi:hypothetical protein
MRKMKFALATLATVITIAMPVVSLMVLPDMNKTNGLRGMGSEGVARMLENRFPDRFVDPPDPTTTPESEMERVWFRNESLARVGIVFIVWAIAFTALIVTRKKVGTNVAA